MISLSLEGLLFKLIFVYVQSKTGLCAGRQHCIYGESRELLTKVWVQEGYLEYRQVPHCDPARYEFLWGPRAHAETKIGRAHV